MLEPMQSKCVSVRTGMTAHGGHILRSCRDQDVHYRPTKVTDDGCAKEKRIACHVPKGVILNRKIWREKKVAMPLSQLKRLLCPN